MPLKHPKTGAFWGKNLRQWHVFGNGHDLFAFPGRTSTRRLETGVVFLGSSWSQDLAHILFYACASIFQKFFIFLLHFRYDNYNLFRKCITLNNRDLCLKRKQMWFFYTVKFSRSTDRISQNVPMILAPTLKI